MEIKTITKKSSLKPEKISHFNHNYYSILKPTIFVLRFIGSPTGLWKQSTPRGHYRKSASKFLAFLMLWSINVGAIADSFATFKAVVSPCRDFDDNNNLLFVLCMNIAGALALDILWWRRRELRELLDVIDFEPKICPIYDTECQRIKTLEIRKKTFKMLAFMLMFTAFMIWMAYMSTDKSHVGSSLVFIIIRTIAILVFAVTLSFFISLSWVFRLKVRRINRRLKRKLIVEAMDGEMPTPRDAKLIQIWFTSYIIQFKKFDLIFKQIAGIFYIVMVWSVLSLAGECIKTVLNSNFEMHTIKSLWQEVFSIAILTFFLYSLSVVEHYYIKLVKLLYHLSLIIKFSSDDIECSLLSKKFKYLGETIHRSGLSLSIFGLVHINRHLIVSTASLLTTYTILMYELSSDKHVLVH